MRNIILFILCIVFSLELNSQIKGIKLWAFEFQKPAFMYLKPDYKTVMECLLYYKVKHPEIVLAQGILETGHFKSNVCINNNNLFGLKKSSTKYYKFTHWSESIVFY